MSPLLSNCIRILLVEPHEIVRSGLRLLLESRPGVSVVGEAGSRAAALQLARETRPDLAVLEFLDGEEKQLDYLAQLREQSPQTRLLILTGVQEEELHHRAIQLGAMGLVLKSKPPDVLFKAIEKIHLGEVWLDRSAVAAVLTRLTRPAAEEEVSDLAKIKTLTKREHEIIGLLAQGYKNKEIAARLYISDITVRHHLTSVYSKLEVSDRTELIIFSYKNGLVSLDAQNGNGKR